MTTITTKLGTITGKSVAAIDTFLGIPYAAPPTGPRRWQPPAPAEPWAGTFEATRHPNRCIQVPYMDVLATRDIPGEESEDCLYLNIYTPAADGKKRPVMFWIHGGAYIQGAANEYDGTVLASDNDVVVVTINYRLGIFGFLDMSAFGETYKGSAALGFQDQIAALTWVRDNIEDFGGDPENVTIFGESAGGGSVVALLAAPSAKGLFHKAIAHSPGEIMGPPMNNGPALSAALGAEGEALLEKLLTLPAPEVFALQIGAALQMGAAVDGTIVTEQPSVALKKGAARDIPFIAGYNKDEGTFLIDAVPEEALPLFGMALGGMIGNGDPAAYFGHLEETMPGASPRERGIQLWQDMFRSSALRVANAANAGGGKGWVYHFNVPTDSPLGCTHAADIAFTFNAFKAIKESGSDGGMVFHDPRNPLNHEIAENWSTMLANFARTGDPSGKGFPQWPVYGETKACLMVDASPHIEDDPDGPEVRAMFGVG